MNTIQFIQDDNKIIIIKYYKFKRNFILRRVHGSNLIVKMYYTYTRFILISFGKEVEEIRVDTTVQNFA